MNSLTVLELAKETGKTKMTVSNAIKRHGIKPAGKKEVAINAFGIETRKVKVPAYDREQVLAVMKNV